MVLRLLLALALLPIAHAGGDAPAHRQRVGFYRGTFDPPHEGHVQLVMNAMREFGLDKVYVLPNPTPEHKPGATSIALRLQMTRAAFADAPGVEVPQPPVAEMASGEEDALVNLLKKKHEEDSVFRIMGSDVFDRAMTKTRNTLAPNESVLVAARGDEERVFPAKTKFGSPVYSFKNPAGNFSSSSVREQILAGQRPKELSEKVWRIVQEEKLYGSALPALPAGCPARFGFLSRLNLPELAPN